jgi:uncharacterized protein (DUF1330 family)
METGYLVGLVTGWIASGLMPFPLRIAAQPSKGGKGANESRRHIATLCLVVVLVVVGFATVFYVDRVWLVDPTEFTEKVMMRPGSSPLRQARQALLAAAYCGHDRWDSHARNLHDAIVIFTKGANGETMSENFVDPSREQLRAFQGIAREGPIQMLNLVRFRERALYLDGREATGAEAYRAYAAASAAPFARVGGRQRWIGRFELTVIGPETEQWDAVFIAEYPSAAAFVAMLRDPEYREAVKHRQAAVATSRLIRLAPDSPGDALGTVAEG